MKNNNTIKININNIKPSANKAKVLYSIFSRLSETRITATCTTTCT